MVKGPCLCGDPYCGSCGDPSLADMEAAVDKLMEVLHKLGVPLEFYTLLIKVAPVLYEALDKWVTSRMDELRADDERYYSHLRDKVAMLEAAAVNFRGESK